MRFDLIRYACIAALVASTTAFAEQAAPPQSAEDCLKAAYAIAEKAEQKKLSNEQIDRIDEMLTRMETHCDAKQFSEAMVVHKDIATFIEKL
jgi:deoxyhypusine synthase